MQKENKKKIIIVSPSANVVDEIEGKELIDKAEKILENSFFEFEYSNHFRGKNRFLSGTPEERAKDIMNAFMNKNVDTIISSQGGDNSNDLLDLLDYEIIAKNEKPFLGLSDITVLLNVIAIKSNIVTYHGLDFLWGLGKNATEYTIKILNSFLNNGKSKIIKNPNTPSWRVMNGGAGEGTFLGGCLPSFCLLLGTKYDPLDLLNSSYILILEDIGESKSMIKSRLVQIKQHKKFNLCQGIIFGSFAFCEQKPKENDISIEELVKEIFSDVNIPIARIEEIGHCVENIIMPIGGKGKLECNQEVKLNFF